LEVATRKSSTHAQK